MWIHSDWFEEFGTDNNSLYYFRSVHMRVERIIIMK